MATYVITYTYRDDQAADRDTHRAAHRAYLGGLVEAGSMLSSGAHVDGSGATLIARAGSTAEVEEMLARDPFVVQGLATHHVVEWNPVLGAFS
jgi:uncharacterized protein YciI